jgi:CRP/FNR family transcriptional regulator, cyclic AMP receptor protein
MNNGDISPDGTIELPDDVWNALVAAGERRDYGAGAWIFVEDDPPGPAYAVVEGMVRVEAARERMPLEVGSFGPHSLFGELAAIDGHPRSASAIATEPTTLIALDAPTLYRLLTDHPSFTLAVLRLLASRLRATTTFAVEHMPQDLDRRLAATLCELARTRGTPEGTLVLLDVTQGELSTLLRADPETTGGAIKRLRARGLVLPGRHSLHVINMPLLEALSRSAV